MSHIQHRRLIQESREFSSKIRRQMARKIETSQQIIISAATKKRNTPKKKLLIYVQQKDLDKNIRKIQSKVSKFSAKLTSRTKQNTSLSLRCSRKYRMTENKLYEANHLYMMKLALIETNIQEKHHIKISPIHSKDDLSY